MAGTDRAGGCVVPVKEPVPGASLVWVNYWASTALSLMVALPFTGFSRRPKMYPDRLLASIL